MFGLSAPAKKVQKSVSVAQRAAVIARLVATLGTQYRSLKQYHAL